MSLQHDVLRRPCSLCSSHTGHSCLFFVEKTVHSLHRTGMLVRLPSEHPNISYINSNPSPQPTRTSLLSLLCFHFPCSTCCQAICYSVFLSFNFSTYHPPQPSQCKINKHRWHLPLLFTNISQY